MKLVPNTLLRASECITVRGVISAPESLKFEPECRCEQNPGPSIFGLRRS